VWSYTCASLPAVFLQGSAKQSDTAKRWSEF
jgi:hypothetical protein